MDVAMLGSLSAIAALVLVPLVRRELRAACGAGARWGLGLGTLALLVGVIGPIVWTPEANQGPLLGIFIVGPLGFCVGAVVGFIRELRRPRARE